MGKKQNKGFSLVEIIIAISVFTVLVGLTGLSASLIKRANFRKAAEKVQRAVVTARTQSMAKGTFEGTILFNTRPNGTVVVRDVHAAETVICNGNIIVSYTDSYNGANATAAVNALKMEFNTNGTLKHTVGGDTGGKLYIRSNDGTLRAEVLIYPVTGKTALNYL